MAICSDCHHCVVASSSGLVYLYNFRTTEILDVFKEHNSPALSALLTEDQQIAVTVSKVRFLFIIYRGWLHITVIITTLPDVQVLRYAILHFGCDRLFANSLRIFDKLFCIF